MKPKPEKAPPLKLSPAPAAIPIKPDIDRSIWAAWLEHCRTKGREDLVEAATAAGEMTVPRRWPQADSPLPKVAKNFTHRLTGERK